MTAPYRQVTETETVAYIRKKPVVRQKLDCGHHVDLMGREAHDAPLVIKRRCKQCP